MVVDVKLLLHRIEVYYCRIRKLETHNLRTLHRLKFIHFNLLMTILDNIMSLHTINDQDLSKRDNVEIWNKLTEDDTDEVDDDDK